MIQTDPGEALASRIAALADPAMRRGRLAALARELPPLASVTSIEQAARGCHEPRWRVLYLAWVQLLLVVRPRPALPAGPLREEYQANWPSPLDLAQLTGAASRADLPFATAVLRACLAAPGPYDARTLPPHVSIEHLPLGVRRAQARLPRRDRLLPLLVDTDPSVVALLADNPMLRQEEIVRVAANRRTHPWALWALLLAPRWLANGPTVVAVACNPMCPPWLLLLLAPLVAAHELGLALRRRPLLDDSLLAALQSLHGGALAEAISGHPQLLANVTGGPQDALAAVGDAGDALAAALADAHCWAVAAAQPPPSDAARASATSADVAEACAPAPEASMDVATAGGTAPPARPRRAARRSAAASSSRSNRRPKT